MTEVGDATKDDLRKLEKLADNRAKYAWGRVRRYGLIDNGLPWLAGLGAGAAGIAAVLEAPPIVTAVAAFASALSTAVAVPVRSKRVHAVRSNADYKDIAWKADQAVKNDLDRTTRLESLKGLHKRWHELEKTAAP